MCSVLALDDVHQMISSLGAQPARIRQVHQALIQSGAEVDSWSLVAAGAVIMLSYGKWGLCLFTGHAHARLVDGSRIVWGTHDATLLNDCRLRRMDIEGYDPDYLASVFLWAFSSTSLYRAQVVELSAPQRWVLSLGPPDDSTSSEEMLRRIGEAEVPEQVFQELVEAAASGGMSERPQALSEL